ncbi:MAG: helix-turn-helix transcriptional regulator [Bacteroidetes bacterium]|nr:helix-turn-helix transcriptional regulator [Bacteroidota bacterium]
MENKEQISEREKIANRLKEARILSGLSQENAAKMLNLQRPAISEIESGKRKVSAEEIIQFSELYKVSTSWILHDEEIEIDEELRMVARELNKMNVGDRNKFIDLIKVFTKK